MKKILIFFFCILSFSAVAMEKNTTLTKIDLRHNSFSDRGVIKLVPVIIEKNNSLYSIQLEHNDNLHSMYIVNKLYDHVDHRKVMMNFLLNKRFDIFSG